MPDESKTLHELYQELGELVINDKLYLMPTVDGSESFCSVCMGNPIYHGEPDHTCLIARIRRAKEAHEQA